MSRFFLIAITSILDLALLAYLYATAQRLYHNLKRKRETVNTFAIQNVKTGMDIRPYNASIYNETKIIQYKHAKWECMTWQMIKLEDGSYLLKNLYTQKTFQPKPSREPGTALWQQPLEANDNQYWEFIKLPNGTYNIKLKGTELYVTASSSENNAPIILIPLQEAADQKWILIEQHPIV